MIEANCCAGVEYLSRKRVVETFMFRSISFHLRPCYRTMHEAQMNPLPHI